MKKVISLALAIMMLLALVACGGTPTSTTTPATSPTDSATDNASTASPEDTTVYTLKWATTENEGTLRYKMLEKPIMDLITEKTNGRIDFNVFYSGTLAGSGAIIKGCQDGVCDAGGDNINSYPGVFPYSELMCVPGVTLGSTFEEKYANIADYNEAYALEEAYGNGVYPLFTAPAVDVILMSKFEVTSTDSYNGNTVCCNGSYAPMFKDFGAATTWVVPPEQYEALRLNVMDATVNGAGPLSAFKLYEVLDYAYYIPFATITSAYYLSLSSYNSLPDDLKAILDELQCGDEFLAINKAYIDAMMADVMTAVDENNPEFQFSDLPADVATAMKDACNAQIADKVAAMDAAGIDGTGALELLNTYA